MRLVVIMPVTVLWQFVPVRFGSVALQMPAKRPLMIAGLAKPTDTWYPAGPYSWKKLGSPIRRKESWAFCPSKVLVWSHSSPRPIRSAPGVATTPYRPGIRLATTACPASGDSVLPSASYFGQVTIVPVIPVCVGSPAPIREIVEIGHASELLLDGSGVPAKLFTKGWLNMS